MKQFEKQKSEWIKVSKKLPKNIRPVLILCTFGHRHIRVASWNVRDGYWVGVGLGEQFNKDWTTHWLPLPKFPREDW